MSYWDEAMREAYEGWILGMPEKITGHHRYRSSGNGVAQQTTQPIFPESPSTSLSGGGFTAIGPILAHPNQIYVEVDPSEQIDWGLDYIDRRGKKA